MSWVMAGAGPEPPCFAFLLKLEAPAKHSEAWLLKGRVQARADTQVRHRRRALKQTGLGTGLSGSEDSNERAHRRGVSLASQGHNTDPQRLSV